MRKLGIIGGMSWLSTEIYYRRINEQVRRKTGGLASAPLIIDSLDFSDVGRATSETDWTRVGSVLADSAIRLEQAGATAILIAANSMHRAYDQVSKSVGIPVLHIADCVGRAMEAAGVDKAALLGTRNVMVEPWYRQRLVRHGVHLLPPDLEDADQVDKIIYDELVAGQVSRNSERTMRTLLTNYGQQGAEAAVLGCTELTLIVDVRANVLPIYDSATIHADAGVEWIMGSAAAQAAA